MADEAFALSPINARASLPTDADYDAICTAFMETSRGRWFLSEYAKRNRNADTRLVLDAVERIEATIASQKQAQAEPAPPPIDPWPELMKAFTKTRIEIAQRMIVENDDGAFESIRTGVEMIRKVSKALRERGWDVRICDVFDTQVSAINDGYTGLLAAQSIESGVQTEVLAAFDALAGQVEALLTGNDPQGQQLDLIVDAVADAMGEDDDFAAALADEPDAPEVPITEGVLDQDAAFHDIYSFDSDSKTAEIVEPATPSEPPPALATPAPSEAEINRHRLYETKAEPYRSAPVAELRPRLESQLEISPADDIEIVDVAIETVTPAAPVRRDDSPVLLRPAREIASTPPVAAPSPSVAAAAAPAPTPAPVMADQIAEGPGDTPAQTAGEAARPSNSLGAALLANGLVRSPESSRSDPLAPFRRMSQAEKVAFFS